MAENKTVNTLEKIVPILEDMRDILRLLMKKQGLIEAEFRELEESQLPRAIKDLESKRFPWASELEHRFKVGSRK